MSMIKRVVLGVAVTLLTTPLMASTFRAADVIYVPAAARTAGGGGAFFKTDAFVTNLTNNRVVVAVGYGQTLGAAPSGNPALTTNLVNLPVLQPGERRQISDIMKTVFNLDQANGFLIFFACREGASCTGTTCDDGSPDCAPISVAARIYNEQTGPTRTFGQLFPGLPWYAFVSRFDSINGLDKVFITGIRQEGQAGVSGFRSNLGLLNASQDYTIQVRVSLFTSTGAPAGEKVYTLPPLAHVQEPVPAISSTFAGEGYAVVEHLSETLAPNGCAACRPGFYAYGSLLDNVTGDPTTLEAQYTQVLDISCVYSGGKTIARRPVRR